MAKKPIEILHLASLEKSPTGKGKTLSDWVYPKEKRMLGVGQEWEDGSSSESNLGTTITIERLKREVTLVWSNTTNVDASLLNRHANHGM